MEPEEVAAAAEADCHFRAAAVRSTTGRENRSKWMLRSSRHGRRLLVTLEDPIMHWQLLFFLYITDLVH